MRVAVGFNFEVAHYTPVFPEGHPNRRLHGHSYEAELIAEGPLDDAGMVVSAERLSVLASVLKGLLDHRCLNEIDELPHPTMECLAQFLLERARINIDQVMTVRISRPTLKQWAEASI